VTVPPAHLNHYQLVVPMQGTVAQAREFANELVAEFGCEVEIKETTPDGLVVRTILPETTDGAENG